MPDFVIIVLGMSVYYAEYTKILQLGRAELSVAEAHGLFSALHSLRSPHDFRYCLASMFNDSPSEQDVNQRTAVQYLEKLFAQSLQNFSAATPEFDLLLPDEDESVAERAGGLQQWSQGYLHGLGLASQQLKHEEVPELAEFLKDLIEIAKLAADDVSDTEENERDLTELIEFVKIGVLLVFEHSSLHDQDDV